MDRERLKYWLALTRLKGIKKKTLRGALEVFSDPRAIFEDNGEGLTSVNKNLAEAVKEVAGWEAIDREFDTLEALGASIITNDDETYPKLLNSTFDPPLLFYTLGAIEADSINQTASVAIVGTRNPSHYGIRMARQIAEELARAGVTVISGMARGCDSAAHRGALDANGQTIAVLGTGIDIAYPKENRKLYEEIIDTGLIVSEFAPGTSPLPHNFPIRNRIISGLSLGVLVVEAPIRSGAMMTARLALDSGREVFAVPGKIDSLKSAGTNALIKDGAGLCGKAADILEGLNLTGFTIKEALQAGLENEDGPTGKRRKELTKRLQSDFGENVERVKLIIGELTRDEPVHIDLITSRTGLQVQTAASLLLEMELKGYVEQQTGKCFLIKG
ncbi:MAG: DNA-processing protein DprA [Thermodesulfobacteriota bacterium]